MSTKSLKLMVIGHVWPQPKATAAGEHILNLVSFFKKMNYEILFVCASQIPSNYSCLSFLGIQINEIKINDDAFDALLLEFNPTVVLFDRFMTEEQFSWRVHQKCPNAITILDTEDLHFLRKKRYEALKNSLNENLTEIAKREIASIYRCDLSLIISMAEFKLLTQQYQLPPQILHHTPLLNTQSKIKQVSSFDDRKDFVFVGNFLHKPNLNCVHYLKNEIWPILSQKLPKANLHIYGSHAAPKHLQLSNPKKRFFVHGYVEDIETELLRARLMLAPIQFGAGQKGKLLKAMQCNLPSITTTIGAEGMVFENKWAGAIADPVNEFIEKAVTLYTQKIPWDMAQQLCKKILDKNFDYNTHFLAFNDRITSLQKHIISHRNNNYIGQILWHHTLRSTEFMSRWIIEKNKKLT